VAHLFDSSGDDVAYETRPAPARRRWVPFAVAILILLGLGGALAWYMWGNGLPGLPSVASLTVPASAPAEAPDTTAGLKELQALQQQVAATTQSNAQALAAQQAEIKRLSDQVAALASKIEALQTPAAAAQAATPAAPSPAPPAPTAARKRPAAAAKQPSGISVGGAPLPPTAR
jgi:uncharacterized coiled-coil protein SlyX